MSQAAKAQEPSMEEILASIRRIIADDDPARSAMPQAAASPAPLRPAAMPPRHQISSTSARPAGPPPSDAMDQQQIDTMMAGLEAQQADANAVSEDVLDLTEQMAAPAEAEA